MSATLRVVEGHLRTYRRTWKGSAVTTFANPVLFLLAMGVGLGTLVDRSAGPATLEGVTYLEFLAPGLLAATAMQSAASESTWPVVAGVKWRKTYQATLATPVGVRDLVWGQLLYVTLRLLVTATVFIVVMAAFGAAGLTRGLLAVLPAVLTGLAFATPITAYAALRTEGYGLVSLFRFGIMPMFLFSGTFFPISQLPAVLQPLAAATPLWHGVELCRAAALGTASALSPVVHVGYLLLWAAVGVPLCMRSFARKLVQ